MRILVTTHRFNPSGLAVLNARNAELCFIDQDDNPEKLEEVAANFDPHGIISRGLDVTARALGLAPSLRVVAKTGSGVDNVDLDAATRLGIPVLKNYGVNSPSVAEQALGLMFAVARNTARHDACVRAGEWSRFYFKSYELRGKRLGLVGFGPSAQILASLVRPLAMPVSVYSPRYRGGDEGKGIEACSSVDVMMSQVDIISLHCALNQETRGMINRESIKRMRPGTWIINTARGGLIDNDALVEGLQSGHLGGAALDVHDPEPLPKTHPLFSISNVVLTPHVGGGTVESAARAHALAAQNVFTVLDGQPIEPKKLVNPKVLDHPRFSS